MAEDTQRASLLERKRWLRGVLTFLWIGAMAPAAVFCGDEELLFPELFALAMGLLVAPKVPWQMNAWRLGVGVMLSACAGVALVHLQLPVGLALCIALCFVAVTQVCLRTNVAPCLPAALLPIFLNHANLWYVPFVFVFLAGVLGIRWLWKRDERFVPVPRGLALRMWAVALAVLCPYVLVTSYFNALELAFPPLIVGFVAMLDPERKAGRFMALCLASFGVAAVLGWLCVSVCGLGFVLASTVIVAGVLLLGCATKIYFPPVAATALLILLQSPASAARYPLSILAGASILAAIAFLARKLLTQPSIKCTL